MLRSLVVSPLFLSALFIACSEDQPTPVAPAGKAQGDDLGAMLDLFGQIAPDTPPAQPDTTQADTTAQAPPDTSEVETTPPEAVAVDTAWTSGADPVAADPVQSQFDIQIIFPDEVIARLNEITPFIPLEEMPEEELRHMAAQIDHFSYAMQPQAKEVIREAAQIWERIIVGDIPKSKYFWIFANYQIEYEVDDVIIIVENGYKQSMAAISVANAGQVFISTDLLEAGSTSGVWSALSRNELRITALHEIGHVLGLASRGYQDEFIKDGAFIGENAMRLFGGKPIPLDRRSSYLHWDQAALPMGLMVPTAPDLSHTTEDVYDFVTDVEVGALEDLGYEVNYTLARSTQRAGKAAYLSR